MDITAFRIFEDLRNRHSGTLQARAKATGMCLFNLYISQHHPLNFILNAGKSMRSY